MISKTSAFELMSPYRKVIFYNTSNTVKGMVVSKVTITPNKDLSRRGRYDVIATAIVRFFGRAPIYEPTKAEERAASKLKKKANNG